MRIDQDLQNDILEEIGWDPILTSSEIGISVKNGVVTLTGYVNSYSQKFAAENAVKRVKGVLAVVENIEVRLPADSERNDAHIAQMAVSALQWNNNIPDDKIIIKVENGWVTLEGCLDWKYQRDAAANSVRDITGVKGVANLITLTPGADAAMVEKNIRRSLERSADVEADNIKVTAIGGKVILEGKARSWSERKAVERAAWSSPGVIEVQDDVVIKS